MNLESPPPSEYYSIVRFLITPEREYWMNTHSFLLEAVSILSPVKENKWWPVHTCRGRINVYDTIMYCEQCSKVVTDEEIEFLY
jgi:hypothetical protein